MINNRDSYTDFNQNKKEIIEVPYRIGTIVELKKDENILAVICQYRITVEGYKQVVNVGLSSNIREKNPKMECEITVEELIEKWKKTDKIIIGKLNPDDYIHIGMPCPEPVLKVSPCIPSNDSENIAELLQGFKYDPSKTDEVLEKYAKLTEQQKKKVKSLKPRIK